MFLQADAQQQYTNTLKGLVRDAEMKESLPGATILVYADTLRVAATKTDDKGVFRIEQLPLQRYRVICRYSGYLEKEINNVEMQSGKETQLLIELNHSVQNMKTLVIRNRKGSVNNSMAMVSARSFSPEEASRYTASRDDIARMVTNFAGVRGSDDSRNDIVVRGNTPNGIIWRVEDLDISNPNHFASFGTTGGPVNIINNKMLGNSDFITGAFPANYGNGISGVFDLKLRNGNTDKHEFTFQAGILGLEATAEGPVFKKSGSSYLISYRYATLALMNKMGINFGTAGNPSYQDFNFKWNLPMKHHMRFSVFALGGKSDIAILSNGTDSTKWTYGRAGRDIHFGSAMALTGFSLQQNPRNGFYHSLTAGLNLNRSYSRYDTLAPDLSRGATYRNRFLVHKLIVHYQNTVRLSKRSSLKSGIIFTGLKMDLVDSNYYAAQKIWFNEAEYRNHTSQWQLYSAYNYSVSDHLKFSTGIHYLRYQMNGSQALEPRFGLSWSPSSTDQFNLGYGLHSNLQPLYIYFLQEADANGNPVQINRNTGLTRSHHLVAGWGHTLGEGMKFKTEVYYQYLFHIPQEISPSAYSPLNQGASFNFVFPHTLENKGRGRNAGVDLSLEKLFQRNWYALLSASLYSSRYKGSDAIWRNTDFNGQFQFNVLSGKEFVVGKARTARILTGFKFNIAGGKWYTPLDPVRSAEKNQYEGIDSLTNTLRFSPYHRLDIRLGFRKNLKKFTHTLSLDLINVYNRKNALGLSYIPSTKETVTEYNLGFLPLFNWLFEF